MKRGLNILVVLVVLLGIGGLAHAAIPMAERNALIDFYTSTTGTDWTNNANWNGAAGTECTWYGVTCDAGGTHVSQISLYKNNLAGTIPATFGNLSNLQYLFLTWNQLTGTIPAELGNLTNLQYINLFNNKLSGTIPAALGNMTKLQDLSLSTNQFTGTIPAELGNLTNLQSLILSGNQLTGTIPAGLGNLTNLKVLDLVENQLTGAIPSALGNLTNLQELSLSYNQLNGTIPSVLMNLTNLQNLSLGENQFTGTIPTELGNLTNLQDLSLSWNQLTGTIPAALGNLTNLQDLSLSTNQLTGTIPVELGNLSNLEYLDLDSNQLTGTIPSALGNLTTLQYLFLQHNQLTGTIPSELGNIPNLKSLALFYNQLTGTIPSALGNLINLQYLSLDGNQLTGPIPTQLINLTNLIDNSSGIRYNALYSSDATLRTFLDAKQNGGAWENTQTVKPTNLSSGAVTNTSVLLTWMPILYVSNTGGYEVYYSTVSGGCYKLFETTSNKNVTGSTVTGLFAGTTYYFRVRTVTNSHTWNQNTVYSEYTPEVSATTSGVAAPVPKIQVTDSAAPNNDLQIPFGGVAEGATSTPQTVTIMNTGTADLTIQLIQISGGSAQEFSLSLNGGSTPCGSLPKTIAAGQNCTITVIFSPTTAGNKNANIGISSDAVNACEMNVLLTGTGPSTIANSAPSAPVLVSPSNDQTGLGTGVTFIWKKATDPDGNSVTYHVFYCTDQSFIGCTPTDVANAAGSGGTGPGSRSTIVYLAGFGWPGLLLIGSIVAGRMSGRKKMALLLIVVLMATGVTLISCKGGGGSEDPPILPSNEMSYTVAGLNSGTTYYWKVVADDSKGGTTASAVWSFKTK